MPLVALRPLRLEWWTLLAIALIGATRIPEPFDGDQALFALMARALHRGATLYVDVWDNKQPGIFLFYQLAGRAFGFSEIGIHLFELIYQLLTALVVMGLLQQVLRQRVLACLGAFLTVGSYYLCATSWHLGQVEGLVGLPILVSLALVSPSAASPAERRTRMLAAGVATGVVALFKLMLGPIPALAWLVAYGVRRSEEGPSAVHFFRDWLLPAFIGSGLVVGGAMVWACLHGGLPELLWAWFTYPVLASAEFAHVPWARLGHSALWFVGNFGIAILLAAGCGFGWRGWRKEVAVMQALAWLLLGAVAIVAQKLSFYEYHFLLLVPPLGILAARGGDGVVGRVSWLRARPQVAVVVLMAIALVPGFRPTLNRVASARHALAEPRWLMAYQDRRSPAYRRWHSELAFLNEPSALAGPIYVFGDPLVLWLGHREQAGAINGWSWGKFVQPLWDRLPRQLATSRPAYVLVQSQDSGLLRGRSPATMALLRDRYQVRDSTSSGTWYQRVDPGREGQ
jgi:hypothetical protein